MLPRVLVSTVPRHVLAQNLQVAIVTIANQTINFTVRITTGTGTFTYTHSSLNTGVPQTTLIPIDSVPTGVHIEVAAGTPHRGNVFLLLQLRIAGVTISTLAEQYVTLENPLQWPPGTIEPSICWPGDITASAVGAGGAGSDQVYTVPNNRRVRVYSLRCALTTVGVNTPLIYLQMALGGFTCFNIASPLVHPAASTRTYNFISNLARTDTAYNANGDIVLAIPTIELNENDTITLTGQDADDVWDDMIVYYEQLVQQ